MSSVEDLTLSLVREFLSRKGLKATLASMDEECPRTEASISNRAALAKAVGVEKLMKKNKEQPTPYRTILEVIVQVLLSKSASSSHSKPTSHDPTSKSHDQPLLTNEHSTSTHSSSFDNLSKGSSSDQAQSADGNPITYHRTSSQVKTPATKSSTVSSDPLFGATTIPKHSTSQQDTQAISFSTAHAPMQNTATTNTKLSMKIDSREPSRRTAVNSQVTNSVIQAGHKAGAKKFKLRSLAEFESAQDDLSTKEQVVTSSKDSLKRDTASSAGGRRSDLYLRDKPNLFGGLSEARRGPDTVEMATGETGQSSGSHGQNTAAVKTTPGSKLMLEDLEFEDIGWTSAPAAPSNQNAAFPKGRPITIETAKALRELLFGTSKGLSFNAEWRAQNFVFSDVPGLQYGLVQHKGGPCGLLAAVQAYILKHLMFGDPHKQAAGSPRPGPQERTEALVSALGDILWKAGDGKRAVVALLSLLGTAPTRTTTTAGYQPDHITEKVIEHDFSDKQTLLDFLKANLPLLQDAGSNGCIQFLLSVLLTKGVTKIRSEMDEPTGRLIGAHGYCTQDLLNLLLTGVAVSNVFNGDMDLGGTGKEKVILRGLKGQSEVGLLSLFEHYQSCKVGSYYKDPVYPIWVVYSESHFSVIFSHQRLLLRERRLTRQFDLHYYDGLANQDEEIQLTIDTQNETPPVSDDSFTPPLELCIRTKWQTAQVNWNGTEPIL